MRNFIPLALLMLAAFALSACGGDYTATNTTPKESQSQGGGTGGSIGPASGDQNDDPTIDRQDATGPSMTAEFNAEVEKAETAWRAFKADRTTEKYVVAMVHMYNTMRYKNIHVKNGHSTSSLRGFREFRRDYWADKSKIAPPADADEDPRLKEAKELFDKSQSAS